LLKDGSNLFSKIKNQYAVSLGSACNSTNAEPSHVLIAMGLEKEESQSCIRFSFGKKSQKHEVEKLAELILSLYK
jgi:cysteine desulfurase